jgi:hypothetical protein
MPQTQKSSRSLRFRILRRVRFTSQNSKMAFIKLGSITHHDEWPWDPRFLDLRTLGWGVRNEAYSLKRACKG